MKKEIIGILVCVIIISISTISVGAQEPIINIQSEKVSDPYDDISFHKILFSDYIAAIWNKEEIEEIRYYHIPSNFYQISFIQPYVLIRIVGKCFSIILEDQPSLEVYYRIKDQRVELRMTLMIGEVFEDIWDGKERFHICNHPSINGIIPRVFNLMITPL